MQRLNATPRHNNLAIRCVDSYMIVVEWGSACLCVRVWGLGGLRGARVGLRRLEGRREGQTDAARGSGDDSHA